MTLANADLNSSFNVNQTDIIGNLVPSSVFNQFDEFGLKLDLQRLPNEKNATYKQRLLDTLTHKANSTYLGMINGITRELGLAQFNCFRIRPRVTSGVFIAENPLVVFKGPFIELWRDKYNNVLEMEIDRFNQSGPAYTIKNLYDYINANSTYFICDQLNTTYQNERAITILNQSNSSVISSEIVQPTTRFKLEYPNTDGGALVPNSIHFTDTTNFGTLVNSVANVNSSGKYYVDLYTGDVTSFNIPNINTTVRYQYIKYTSAFMVSSPVIIHAMNDINFTRILFEQILGDDGKYYNGLPTAYGADKINELFSVYGLYYGA